ncbi:MAG: FAD-dependent oxidoreductase [Thermoleophilia bacterium]|nr:FAD-dependent oxidoreductase [Thermoleophilia bacterium]
MHFDYLIIGGGLAAATAMKELVRIDPGAGIGLIAEENEPPYDRPPLSKDFLLGKKPREGVFLLNDDFFSENGIQAIWGRPAVSVDAERHRVTIENGGESGYNRLLIATGCRLRRLSCPGADLPGLYYLRTLAESERLSRAAERGGQAVVIGGGFIGLEVASVLSQLELSVTLIHRGERLLENFGSEELSTYYEELFASRGIHTVYKDEAAELAGTDAVESVITKAGRILPCNFAVAGIGVFPDTGFLDGSGIESGNGVVVDERLRASAADVYAAGDVANFFDPLFGWRRRIEHWDNAIRQGRLAAVNMAGGSDSYSFISYFYSTMFGLTFEFFGDMQGCDETIIRGSFDTRSAAVLYLHEGVLRAAFMQGRFLKERNVVKRLISERQSLETVRGRLADESFDLEDALAP